MKYLCLIYSEEKKFDRLAREETDAVIEECRVFNAGLEREHKLLGAERLQPVATAKTLRFAGGRATVTDGPFAETKEQLGGFYLIDARDMDEALKIARDIPPARFGSVEVRPIWEYR